MQIDLWVKLQMDLVKEKNVSGLDPVSFAVEQFLSFSALQSYVDSLFVVLNFKGSKNSLYSQS